MIGTVIQGVDLQGKKCEGMIMDKIIIPQVVNMPGGNGISLHNTGSRQSAILAVTAYLVYSEHTGLHCVAPNNIQAIAMVPEGMDSNLVTPQI